MNNSSKKEHDKINPVVAQPVEPHTFNMRGCEFESHRQDKKFNSFKKNGVAHHLIVYKGELYAIGYNKSYWRSSAVERGSDTSVAGGSNPSVSTNSLIVA